jgi:hypothetical protein
VVAIGFAISFVYLRYMWLALQRRAWSWRALAVTYCMRTEYATTDTVTVTLAG